MSSRRELLAPSISACPVVYGLATCSDADIEWLRSASRPLNPPCVVVARISVECLRRLDPLRSPGLRVLWADEAESRLVEVLEEFGKPSWDPMRRLGLRLLSDPSLRPSVRETISRVCGLHDDAAATRFVPANSVGRLAGEVHLAGATLSKYWKEDAPLQCRLKEFMNWAVLLWTVRARAGADWDVIADHVGLRRRTLEINFMRLAGCTLAAAAEDPERVVGRFNQWVDSVWEPRAAHGSKRNDPVPARASFEQAG
ncbi:MAG: hypothetical protein OXR82_07190 [Gammaproteobacteria bacterium]|nr:hypothetical protein [Gammaproteobacteria bacterium]MDE0258159.1 hypothetical protein [Gammaproteobacteria bacterium]